MPFTLASILQENFNNDNANQAFTLAAVQAYADGLVQGLEGTSRDHGMKLSRIARRLAYSTKSAAAMAVTPTRPISKSAVVLPLTSP